MQATIDTVFVNEKIIRTNCPFSSSNTRHMHIPPPNISRSVGGGVA